MWTNLGIWLNRLQWSSIKGEVVLDELRKIKAFFIMVFTFKEINHTSILKSKYLIVISKPKNILKGNIHYKKDLGTRKYD